MMPNRRRACRGKSTAKVLRAAAGCAAALVATAFAVLNPSGRSSPVEQLSIQWPGGPVNTLSDVGAGQAPVSTPLPTSFVPDFVDVSLSVGLPQNSGLSWGAAWADYDDDGWPDLYYGRHQGRYASLYHNLGGGTFADVGVAAGIAIQQDRHGCIWGDYDADHD